MDTKRYLQEAASLVSESASKDGTWKVRLISEGKGSSGTYTRELLENHFSAFDGFLSFKNHPVGWDGPQSRDFTMIVGELVGETWVEDDERGMASVMGNFLPDPEFRDKLERYKHKLGLSIYIEGSGYVDDDGEFIVDWFHPNDPFGSVDVVIAPGARGKFMETMRKVYSDRMSEAGSPGGRQAENKKETKMDEELKEALKGISDALTVLVAEKKTAEAVDAQVVADKAAVTTAVEAYDAAVAAIDAAELLPGQVAELRAAAKNGVDVAPLIETARQVKEDAVKFVEEQANQSGGDGVILGETVSQFGAWK